MAAPIWERVSELAATAGISKSNMAAHILAQGAGVPEWDPVPDFEARLAAAQAAGNELALDMTA